MISVRPGQVISFVYNKGSNPGTRRLVELHEVTQTHIKGNDLNAPDNDCYRNYLVSEVAGGQVQILAEPHEEVVPLGNILKDTAQPINSETVNAIYSMLNPKKKGVRYDSNHKVIVVRRDDMPNVQFNISKTKTTIEFVNENGQSIHVYFNHIHPLPQFEKPHVMTCPLDNDTLRDFAKAIDSLVNGPPQTAVDGWAQHVEKQAKAGNPFYAGCNDHK